MDLGSRLRALREERGLSRAELAYKVSMSESALRKVEESDTGAPSFPNGVELAWALRCWPDELTQERPHRSDVAFEVEGIRCELRLRVHGGEQDRRRIVSALRAAVATIGALPPDTRLDEIEAELIELQRRTEETLAEVRRIRDEAETTRGRTEE